MQIGTKETKIEIKFKRRLQETNSVEAALDVDEDARGKFNVPLQTRERHLPSLLLTRSKAKDRTCNFSHSYFRREEDGASGISFSFTS